MEQLSRAIVVAAIIIAGAFVLRGVYPADRYGMIAAQGGAYRIDHLTGAVIFCDALICRALPLATFKAPPAPPPASAPKGATT